MPAGGATARTPGREVRRMTAFPITLAVPPRFTGPVPPTSDVTVIGGGIAGVMTAWFLREKGLSVLLCEKGRIAAEQSSRNWGWIRQQGRDPAELPIMVEALRHWKHLSQTLGEDLGFRQRGVTYLADTAKDVDDFEAWLPHAHANGVDTRLLSRAETEARFGPRWVGALETPSDAQAEPWAAVPLIAEALASKGAILREACAVRTLDLAAGRVAGVVTEHGAVRCDTVVLAGGAWSSLMLRSLGLGLPQLSVLASVAATEPVPGLPDGAFADGEMGIRRRRDGGLTIAPGSRHDFFIGPDAIRALPKYLETLRRDLRSTRFRPAAPKGYPDAWTTPRRWPRDTPSPFEAMRILNPAPNRQALARVRDRIDAAFGRGRPTIRTAWAGMIDTMPDLVPVLDVTPIPGLALATGLSGHGFGIGPGVGRVMADLVTGGDTGHDLHRFRYARFTDGSPIDFGAAL